MIQQNIIFQEGRTLTLPENYWVENMMAQSCQLYVQRLGADSVCGDRTKDSVKWPVEMQLLHNWPDTVIAMPPLV